MLYQRLVRDSWADLAEPIRSLHSARLVRARGHLRVDRGPNLLARLLATMLRLPRPSVAAETRLTVRVTGNGERWERTIDGRPIATRQYESRQHLAERFGASEFRFALEARERSLFYVQRAAAFVLGRVRLRIPDVWAPRVEAREDPAGPTAIRVDVRVTLPLLGLLIAYDGTMELDESAA